MNIKGIEVRAIVFFDREEMETFKGRFNHQQWSELREAGVIAARMTKSPIFEGACFYHNMVIHQGEPNPPPPTVVD